MDSLAGLGAPIQPGVMGTTAGGRAIPVVVASRPRIGSPEEARRSGRPVVYLQGNVHGGEVEGKEALQALLRDLSLDPRPNVLDSLVLVVVPIYNVDGNEASGPQAANRSEQNGPDRIGQRPNAQGLDLNRDYVKAEAPETRASLRMFDLWAPDVFVDLHTTDGSYHGYALTYAPSLSPAAGESSALTRDLLLPELRRRVRERRGFETFDYGNFSLRYGADVTTDSTREGWFTYDSRPRFGTNYFGLRGGVSVLGEAYSHDPFERQLAVEAFVVDSIVQAPRPFQGHREVRVQGRWVTMLRTLPAGSFLVSTAQPLGTLAAFLLEPESEDGLTTWNFFDPFLRVGEAHPALRAARAGLLGGRPPPGQRDPRD